MNKKLKVGDIVLIRMPSEGRNLLNGIHPCVIFDIVGNVNVIVVPITSVKNKNIINNWYEYLLDKGRSSLPKKSKLKFELIRTFEISQVLKVVGSADSDIIKEIANFYLRQSKKINKYFSPLGNKNKGA